MVESPEQTAARSVILETKLYAPRWRTDLIPRARLLARLERVTERKLTLVSAPAGFGKSTLLAEWLAATPTDERPFAWVSLDQGDNDPTLFWAYFIAAVQKVQPGVGESVLTLLHSHQTPPIEALLGTLLNEISANSGNSSLGSGHDFVLVLDDYHVIDSEQIHSGVAFLLEHLPPQMHLIITGRTDPPLPLARLRGRGQSTELRASDLRFTASEAADFLSDVMGLELSKDHVTALEARTEGWIAGLQMAALSMQGRDDISEFISAFTGDDRYIVDYLGEEVLQRQPERVRNFLLQTSILDRLSGSLCDSVTGQEDGKGMLETLERNNLFLVPLDGNRQWYRYHHLFGEVLRSHLMEEQPDQLPALHRQAGDWYAKNGQPSDVVRHALDGEDWERAAAVMELEAMAMMSRCEEPTLIEWLKKLPEEVIRSRPVLSVYYAFIALNFVGLDAAEDLLRDAERLMDASDSKMVIVDEKAFLSLPGSIAVVRAYQAGAASDVAGTSRYAQTALDLLPEGEYFWSGAARALLGISYWASGNLEEAHSSFADGINSLKRVGDTDLEVSGEHVLGKIRMAQGRLNEAKRLFENALKISMDIGEPTVLGTVDLYVGLSDLQCEYGDIEAARQTLLKGERLGENAAIPQNRHHSYIVRARIKQIEGDQEGALDLLSEAERHFVNTPTPDIQPVAAIRTRGLIALGRLAEAAVWVRNQGLAVDGELSYLREFEYVTLAKLLIAQYKRDPSAAQTTGSIHDAVELLKRLLEAAEERDRTGSIIEILVQQAVAHGALGDIPSGLVPLERALALAEPEGYVRIFIDEGEPMRALLRKATTEDSASPYTRRLLAAFDKPVVKPTDPESLPTTAPAALDGLAESLSNREIEVLALVASGATNQQIADQLVVSMSTVKTHINRTYRKLDVHSRTQAVAKIRQLGIA